MKLGPLNAEKSIRGPESGVEFGPLNAKTVFRGPRMLHQFGHQIGKSESGGQNLVRVLAINTQKGLLVAKMRDHKSNAPNSSPKYRLLITMT